MLKAFNGNLRIKHELDLKRGTFTANFTARFADYDLPTLNHL